LLNIVFLHHPNSQNLLKLRDFRSRKIQIEHLNCGFTNSYKEGLRESDLFPSYCSYNTILFETSCILSVWEHANEIFQDGPVVILHTDIIPRFPFSKTIDYLSGLDSFACGLTIPEHHHSDTLVVGNVDDYRASLDPWRTGRFDGLVDIWDLIRTVDKQAWEFAHDHDPVMIYGHQFAVSRDIFDKVAKDIANIVLKLRLGQCGLWTPHVFERLWAIRFAMQTDPMLLSSFAHKLSSGSGDSDLQLYGHKSYKFMKLRSRIFDHFED